MDSGLVSVSNVLLLGIWCPDLYTKRQYTLLSLVFTPPYVHLPLSIHSKSINMHSLPPLWMVACQAPLSRQEYWVGLSFPSAGDLPDPGIEPRSPTLQVDTSPAEPPGKPNMHRSHQYYEGHRKCFSSMSLSFLIHSVSAFLILAHKLIPTLSHNILVLIISSSSFNWIEMPLKTELYILF